MKSCQRGLKDDLLNIHIYIQCFHSTPAAHVVCYTCGYTLYIVS